MVSELDVLFNESFFNFTVDNMTGSHYCVVAGINTVITCLAAIAGLLIILVVVMAWRLYKV